MNIAVYCSAKDQIPEEYKLLGTRLGEWIAEANHTLVFGGATGGLMSCVSEAAFCNKGKVIGIVPKRIIQAGRTSNACTELIEVDTMSKRKQQMRDLADLFVCLPGSYGTLDEMFDVIAAGTVMEHHKPLYIVNYNGFYSPLKEQVEHMKELQFIPKDEVYQPQWVDSIEELIATLEKKDN